MRLHKESQADRPGVSEHPSPPQPVSPIDEDLLAKAIEIIRMLDGINVFDDEKQAASRLANTHAIPAGLKP